MNFYRLRQIIALLVCLVLFISTPLSVGALTKEEMQAEIDRLQQESNALQADINRLKAQKNDQDAIKKALEKQIDNLQQQIDVCNEQINKSNAEIAASEAEIEKKNIKIEESKLQFKKRIRAIYMSNTGSNVQILLGAENFADFLALSELTKDVSARDKKLVSDIVKTIDEIQQEIKKNEQRVAEQTEIKKTIATKQDELERQVAEVMGVISDINKNTANLSAQIAQNKKDMDNYASEIAGSFGTSGNKYDGSAFKWPCPGYYLIISGFGPRWSSHHSGIDIAGSNIKDKPVIASASGTVTKSVKSCTHNYGGSGKNCGCGEGWGNHVAIDHGRDSSGKTLGTLYAHMRTTTVNVGQYVAKGQVIGYVGSTGWSTGWHLHYEVYLNGKRVDPEDYVGPNVK